VKIYDYENNIWRQVGDNINGEDEGDYSGWSISLSTNGNIIAISSINNDNVNSLNSEHRRIINLVDNSWCQLGSNINGYNIGDKFGNSVNLSSDGTRVAISSINNNNNSTDITNVKVGQVKIYDLINNDWLQVGDDIYGEENEGYFGNSLSISSNGNRIAISSKNSDIDNVGIVNIYDLSNNEWVKLIMNINLYCNYTHLSSDGNRLVTSVINNSNSENIKSGLVKVYEINNGNLQQIG